MKIWLLLAIVLFLLWNYQEGFNPATTRPSGADKSIIKAVTSYTGLDTKKDNAKIKKYVDQLQKFYDSVYLPKKKTPTDEQVKKFTSAIKDKDIDKSKLATLINYIFLTTEKDKKKPPKPKDPKGTKTGTDTGGSSTIRGPTSGGTKGNKIWGPVFPGFGEGDGWGKGGDSTKKNNYPVLLGPKPDKSTMVEGAGIVRPSKSWQLAQGVDFSSPAGATSSATKGSSDLPSAKSLGSDESSQYLPYSRTPGDQDLIPDPYRVSSTFTTSSYSSKTEPVPFLTDFSAFQK